MIRLSFLNDLIELEMNLQVPVRVSFIRLLME